MEMVLTVEMVSAYTLGIEVRAYTDAAIYLVMGVDEHHNNYLEEEICNMDD